MSARDTRTYTHRFDLWKPTDAITAGSPTTRTYAQQATLLRGYLQTRSSIGTPAELAFADDVNLTTTDELHLPLVQSSTAQNTAAATVTTNWIIVNRTVLPSGANSPDYGQQWIVRGDPRVINGAASRPARKVVVYCSRLQRNEPGVS